MRVVDCFAARVTRVTGVTRRKLPHGAAHEGRERPCKGARVLLSSSPPINIDAGCSSSPPSRPASPPSPPSRPASPPSPPWSSSRRPYGLVGAPPRGAPVVCYQLSIVARTIICLLGAARARFFLRAKSLRTRFYLVTPPPRKKSNQTVRGALQRTSFVRLQHPHISI